MEKVTIKLFGAFQSFVPSGEIELYVDLPTSPGKLRSHLYSHLNQLDEKFYDQSLINDSRFATEDYLIADSDIISEKKLAILPPVCGG